MDDLLRIESVSCSADIILASSMLDFFFHVFVFFLKFCLGGLCSACIPVILRSNFVILHINFMPNNFMVFEYGY